MKTTEVLSLDGCQVVRLPDECRFVDAIVSIRKDGEASIRESARADQTSCLAHRVL